MRILQSPQAIQMSRDGAVHEATVAWQLTEDYRWTVSIECAEFAPIEALADDAFEALCLVREQLEPLGWRVGVVGAQINVWPSGMARDQGGGQSAYSVSEENIGGVVATFEPADPATATTVAVQRAEAERLLGAIALANQQRREGRGSGPR